MINKEFFQRVVIDEYLAKITPEQYFQDLERINSEPDPYDRDRQNSGAHKSPLEIEEALSKQD